MDQPRKRVPLAFRLAGRFLVSLSALIIAGCASFVGPTSFGNGTTEKQTARTLRVAAFNTALSRDKPGELAAAMAAGDDAPARAIAEILQRTRPDVVLLSEVDRDPTGQVLLDFQRHYLAVPQNGATPIGYAHVYAPEVNTGVPSGVDLNRDGEVGGPGDAYGWGNYPGHYGMAVLSRFPIERERIRTFRDLRWWQLIKNQMPRDWYGDAANHVRLSSKTHADAPVRLPDGTVLHLLISHPTPPVFDGPEDRNGRRNHDEVEFWSRYLGRRLLIQAPNKERPGHRYADGFIGDDPFVVLGDLNADPHDGDSFGFSVNRLLMHNRLQTDVLPTSRGAVEAAREQGGVNAGHAGDPALDTADFPDRLPNGPGNLRVDYVLPSRNLNVVDAGVFWPASDEPHADLVKASDHRLVWVDLAVE